MYTLAVPLAARALAIMRPIPVPAPVTTATRPLTLKRCGAERGVGDVRVGDVMVMGLGF